MLSAGKEDQKQKGGEDANLKVEIHDAKDFGDGVVIAYGTAKEYGRNEM